MEQYSKDIPDNFIAEAKYAEYEEFLEDDQYRAVLDTKAVLQGRTEIDATRDFKKRAMQELGGKSVYAHFSP